jgi:hypothetical protein
MGRGSKQTMRLACSTTPFLLTCPTNSAHDCAPEAVVEVMVQQCLDSKVDSDHLTREVSIKDKDLLGESAPGHFSKPEV